MIEGRDFAAASTIGARERQEDDWGSHLDPPALEEGARLLAAVADGMGGMPAGGQASNIAIQTFFDSYPAIQRHATARLRHALAHANREVGIAAEANPELEGMGCTIVAALFFAEKCEWLSIGDSLILLCRDGELERINPLHTYAQVLERQVEQGELTLEEAESHPGRELLTSAVQGAALEEVAQGELQLAERDIVVLASDGVSALSEEEIASICAAHAEEGAAAIAGAIVARIDALARANQDNATVLVVRHTLE